MTTDAIPLADARPFRRLAARTRLVRLCLALGAVGAAAAGLAFSLRDPPVSAPLLSPGSDGSSCSTCRRASPRV